MGKRPKDNLPCAEPHIATSRDEALLCWGPDLVDEDSMRNWYEPTDAAPGSDEKLVVLRARADNHLPLWHPEDRCDFNGWKKPLPSRMLEQDR